MRDNKKGAELTLNVIVIAAIVLFVMVILLLIFTGRIGEWGKQVVKCETKGGVCAIGGCAENARAVDAWKCDMDGDGTTNEGPGVDGVCCISV